MVAILVGLGVSGCAAPITAHAPAVHAAGRAARDLYPDPNRVPSAPPPPPATPGPALAPPASPASMPGFGSPTSRLISAGLALDVPVGSYADCSGESPIDRDRADLDPCFPGRLYFVGHSPGVFTPLLAMGAGDVITWYDAKGNGLRLRVVSARDFRRNSASLKLAQPDVVAQFQTCLTPDGAMDRILDAVRA